MEMDGLPVTLKLHADNWDLTLLVSEQQPKSTQTCCSCALCYNMLRCIHCIENGYQCVTGAQSSYEREGVISAPIHMDTVACYGSENKLTDCTYHTDTSEDMHNKDIWINCNKTIPTQQPTSVTNNDRSNSSEQPTSATNKIDDTETTTKELKSDTPSNTVALAVSLVGLAISLVVIGLLICLLVYNRKRKSATTTNR